MTTRAQILVRGIVEGVGFRPFIFLQARKLREQRPFALMAESIDSVRRYCYVSETEKRLLLSNRRPIVLLERRADCAVPADLAPGANTLGFMLPYFGVYHQAKIPLNDGGISFGQAAVANARIRRGG